MFSKQISEPCPGWPSGVIFEKRISSWNLSSHARTQLFYIWTMSGKSELRLIVSSARGGLSIHYFWLFLLPLWYTKKPRVAFECKVCVTPNRRRRNCTVRIFWGNTTRYIGGKLKPWRIATQKRPYKKLLIPA